MFTSWANRYWYYLSDKTPVWCIEYDQSGCRCPSLCCKKRFTDEWEGRGPRRLDPTSRNKPIMFALKNQIFKGLAILKRNQQKTKSLTVLWFMLPYAMREVPWQSGIFSNICSWHEVEFLMIPQKSLWSTNFSRNSTWHFPVIPLMSLKIHTQSHFSK